MKLKFGNKKSIRELNQMKKQWYEQNIIIEPADVDLEEISFEACGCMSLKRSGWDIPSFAVKEILEEKEMIVWEIKCFYFVTCKLKLPARFSYFDEYDGYQICECACRKEIITDMDGNLVDSTADNSFDGLQMKLPGLFASLEPCKSRKLHASRR